MKRGGRLEKACRSLGWHVDVLLGRLLISGRDGIVSLLLEPGDKNPELRHGLILGLLGAEGGDGGRNVSHLDCVDCVDCSCCFWLKSPDGDRLSCCFGKRCD